VNAAPTNPVDLGSSTNIPKLTEHLFRHESGKLVSVLTGIFGIQRLQMAEDIVQESLIRALQTWPYYGVPKNPAAWLTQTAKNMALDIIRREKSFRDKQDQIIATVEQWSSKAETEDAAKFEDEIKDDRLRLMFTCCHPLIPQEAQIALALKTLCGFSPIEIAQGFLTSEAAIAKRLTRARSKIQELQLPFEIPTGEELSLRLEGVLKILYLLFNEGYKASSGESLIRESLCHEAIRLATLLASHPATSDPKTHALLALMWFNTARLAGRVDSDGNLLLLKDQNRNTWDQEMILRGLVHLGQAATGDELSEFHLQAGIAACHSMARDYTSTDWARILAYYDRWVEINDSPIVALNRAVAIAEVSGPDEGINAVNAISQLDAIKGYYLTHAILAELESRKANYKAAVKHWKRALELSEHQAEKAFLTQQLNASQTAA